MKFITSLLGEKGSISSKRFISIIGLLLLVVVVFAALYGKVVNDVYIGAIVSIILGNGILTVVTNKNLTENK